MKCLVSLAIVWPPNCAARSSCRSPPRSILSARPFADWFLAGENSDAEYKIETGCLLLYHLSRVWFAKLQLASPPIC